MSVEMRDLDERFFSALRMVACAWRRSEDRRLKSLGVSKSSWLAIASLAKASQPLSQSELAAVLEVEGATIVTMLDRLTKAGLVVRQPSSSDRRVKRVVLTNAGMRIYVEGKKGA